MIIQARYDLPCKDYIAGFYSDSDSEDERHYDPPVISGSGKSYSPIKIDVFKIDATLFCQSLPYCIPASLGFNEIDGRYNRCIYLAAVSFFDCGKLADLVLI